MIIYGPQAWTAGTFTIPTTNTGPDANYPEMQYRERVQTRDGLGPSGERILDTYQVSPDYSIGALTVVNFGPSSGYWDATGAGNGVFYEGDFYFGTDVESDTLDFAYPFTFGIYRTTPSVGFVEMCAIRAALTEGLLYVAENGSEIEPGFGSISADNAWHSIRAYVLPSSDNGTATDGVIRVWLDEVLVFEKTTSQIFVASFGGNPASHINYAQHGRYGLLPTTNFSIFTESASASASPSESDPDLPSADSVKCCKSKPKVPLGPNPGKFPNPPLQPWDPSCAGGGIVLTESDVIDVETWIL